MPLFGTAAKSERRPRVFVRRLEVLSGKRSLTVKMLIALRKHLNIPMDTLLGEGRRQA